jgi:hypothetical protein
MFILPIQAKTVQIASQIKNHFKNVVVTLS